jgi:hypothetical protein
MNEETWLLDRLQRAGEEASQGALPEFEMLILLQN